MPLPLPNQASDDAAQQNFREIQQYLSGTEQSIAEANLAAAIALKAAATQPAASVSNSANQSIANVTDTTLAFDSEFFDNNVIHDTVTNNSRLTCKTAGLYIVYGNVHWAGATAGGFTAVHVNGARAALNDSSADRGTVVYLALLAVNDYVECQVRQVSGGALNALASGTTFSMARLSGV